LIWRIFIFNSKVKRVTMKHAHTRPKWYITIHIWS